VFQRIEAVLDACLVRLYLALHKFAIRLRPVESRLPFSSPFAVLSPFRSSFPRQLDWDSDTHSAGLVQLWFVHDQVRWEVIVV